MNLNWREFLEAETELLENRKEKYDRGAEAVSKALKERKNNGKFSVKYRSAIRDADKSEKAVFDILRQQFQGYRISSYRVINPIKEPISLYEAERILERGYEVLRNQEAWKNCRKSGKEFDYEELESLVENSLHKKISLQQKKGMIGRWREFKRYGNSLLSLGAYFWKGKERLESSDKEDVLKKRMEEYLEASDLSEEALYSDSSIMKLSPEIQKLTQLEYKLLEEGTLWFQGLLDESPVPEYFTGGEVSRILEKNMKWVSRKRKEMDLGDDSNKIRYVYTPIDIYKMMDKIEENPKDCLKAEGAKRRIYRTFTHGTSFLDMVPEVWTLETLRSLDDLDKKRYLDWDEEGVLMSLAKQLFSEEEYEVLKKHYHEDMNWSDISKWIDKSKQALSAHSAYLIDKAFVHLDIRETQPEELLQDNLAGIDSLRSEN